MLVPTMVMNKTSEQPEAKRMRKISVSLQLKVKIQSCYLIAYPLDKREKFRDLNFVPKEKPSR